MSLKSFLAKPFAKIAVNKVNKWANSPIQTQENVFQYLVSEGCKTAFGTDHDFVSINSYSDFKKRVPINDYEGLRTYVDRIVAGEENVLWKGKPIYFAKTSGTTSGAKYIPITKESMPTHIKSARNALLSYINETGDASFVNGKMIFFTRKPCVR